MSRFPFDRVRLFDPRAFGLAFVVSLASLVGGALVLPAPLAYAGPAVGGAAVADRRCYLEVALAGAFAAGVSLVLSPLLAAVRPTPAAVGTGGGALAALAGHYLARRVRGST
ncbi:MAG: hypothetical protein ABEJ06_04065 [Haloarculaceae archaeon]